MDRQPHTLAGALSGRRPPRAAVVGAGCMAAYFVLKTVDTYAWKAGLGAALLGVLADHTSLDFVYRVCSILPAIGVLMAAMPKSERQAI